MCTYAHIIRDTVCWELKYNELKLNCYKGRGHVGGGSFVMVFFFFFFKFYRRFKPACYLTYSGGWKWKDLGEAHMNCPEETFRIFSRQWGKPWNACHVLWSRKEFSRFSGEVMRPQVGDCLKKQRRHVECRGIPLHLLEERPWLPQSIYWPAACWQPRNLLAGCGVLSVCYSLSVGVPFLGGKSAGGGLKLTTHQYLIPRLMIGANVAGPLTFWWHAQGQIS